MKVFSVTFEIKCPKCDEEEKPTFHGIPDMLVEWIQHMADQGIYPGWHCTNCRSDVAAKMGALVAIEEGEIT